MISSLIFQAPAHTLALAARNSCNSLASEETWI